MFRMLLIPRPPFDFARTLRFILSPPALPTPAKRDEFAPLLDYFEDGEYRRVVEIAGQQLLYGVSEAKLTTPAAWHGHRSSAAAGSGQVLGRPAAQSAPSPELWSVGDLRAAGRGSHGRNPDRSPRPDGVSGGQAACGRALRVRILAGPSDTATEREVWSLVERQFSTGLDLKPFYRLAASDPVLSHLVRHFRGMRIPQAASVYELLISAILEQQVNLSFAHQVKKALIEAYGMGLDFEGRRYNAFPDPAALAITGPPELRRLQVSGPKARYIIGISRAVLDGGLDLEGLRQLEPSIAHAKLTAQRGVGPWTAHYVGLRGLGHLDCLPAADVGLQKAIERLYRLRKPPTAARVEKLARAWAGWRSYATFYLWLTFWEDADWRAQLMRQIRSRR
jgi:DNA-3-methyladenine glycosylase II